MGVEFADRLKRVVDEYNNRRRDESYANEVLDDIAGKLADLLAELKTKRTPSKIGIDYEEKAFYDILKPLQRNMNSIMNIRMKKMLELSKKIKVIVDDKSRYTDWSTRDDIKANLQVDLILLLDEYGYPPVTLDDVYKEVLEQAENFKVRRLKAYKINRVLGQRPNENHCLQPYGDTNSLLAKMIQKNRRRR